MSPPPSVEFTIAVTLTCRHCGIERDVPRDEVRRSLGDAGDGAVRFVQTSTRCRYGSDVLRVSVTMPTPAP